MLVLWQTKYPTKDLPSFYTSRPLHPVPSPLSPISTYKSKSWYITSFSLFFFLLFFQFNISLSLHFRKKYVNNNLRTDESMYAAKESNARKNEPMFTLSLLSK
ncbi:hypothetical protein PanWU01x14_347140 [Parasponia andersonii]|uniref:Transmembrane protein n=1 Tax=Parasponia andersonii TaxID=3476 RepID=A0A2P5AC53_PARAD|nr:hypothetical protein PanWU01x14_347140 [Parasponia andersonii]